MSMFLLNTDEDNEENINIDDLYLSYDTKNKIKQWGFQTLYFYLFFY